MKAVCCGCRMPRVAALFVAALCVLFALDGWLHGISASARLPLADSVSNFDANTSMHDGAPSRSSEVNDSDNSVPVVDKRESARDLLYVVEGWSVLQRAIIRQAPLQGDGLAMCTAVRPSGGLSFLEHACGCEWNCPLLPSGVVDRDRWNDALLLSRSKHADSKKFLVVRSRNDEVLGPTTMIPHSVAFFPPQRPRSGDMISHSTSFAGRWVNPWSCVAEHVDSDEAARRSSLSSANGIRHVMFLGHSHVRVLAAMLCMMLNLTHCHAFRRKLSATRLVDYQSVHDDFLTIGSPPGAARTREARFAKLSFGVSFVTSLYDLRRRLHAVGRFNFTDDAVPSGVVTAVADARVAVALRSNSSATFGFVSPSLVVYARGLWDLAYMDTRMDVLFHEVSSGLVELLRQLPRTTRVVLYLPHYTQPIRKTRSRWQFSLRNRCLHPVRLQRLRSVLLCALRRTIDDHPDLASRIGLFDVWRETDRRELRPFVDYGGHHYHDIVLEALVMKLLRQHVCPLPADGTHERLVRMALSNLNVSYCDDVSLGRELPSLEEGCACHNYSLPVDGACRLLKSDRYKRR